MSSSWGLRRPHVCGIVVTFRVEVEVYWDIRDSGRSQSVGIFAVTESLFDLASSCQFAMEGVVSILALILLKG